MHSASSAVQRNDANLILCYLELKHLTSIFVRLRILSKPIICDHSGAFAVTTKLDSEGVGCRIIFGRNGNIVSETQVARTTGTTVLVTNLFEALPVRRGEFLRTIKKQFQKMVKVLQSYAIIAVGVRIVVTNVGKVRNYLLILPSPENILYLQLSHLSVIRNRAQSR
jgi:DNA mismatch repair ATPase MutL